MEAVSNAVCVCVKTLLGDPPPRIDLSIGISEDCLDVVSRVTRIQSNHWDCFQSPNSNFIPSNSVSSISENLSEKLTLSILPSENDGTESDDLSPNISDLEATMTFPKTKSHAVHDSIDALTELRDKLNFCQTIDPMSSPVRPFEINIESFDSPIDFKSHDKDSKYTSTTTESDIPKSSKSPINDIPGIKTNKSSTTSWIEYNPNDKPSKTLIIESFFGDSLLQIKANETENACNTNVWISRKQPTLNSAIYIFSFLW